MYDNTLLFQFPVRGDGLALENYVNEDNHDNMDTPQVDDIGGFDNVNEPQIFSDVEIDQIFIAEPDQESQDGLYSDFEDEAILEDNNCNMQQRNTQYALGTIREITQVELEYARQCEFVILSRYSEHQYRYFKGKRLYVLGKISTSTFNSL